MSNPNNQGNRNNQPQSIRQPNMQDRTNEPVPGSKEATEVVQNGRPQDLAKIKELEQEISRHLDLQKTTDDLINDYKKVNNELDIELRTAKDKLVDDRRVNDQLLKEARSGNNALPSVILLLTSDQSTENISLREVIEALLFSVINNTVTANQAQIYFHAWHRNLPLKKKQEFLVNRSDAENTMNYFKQVLDTLTQELPMLFVK